VKRLGIDFGSRRLGLALSDPGGTLAFPYATLERGARESAATPGLPAKKGSSSAR